MGFAGHPPEVAALGPTRGARGGPKDTRISLERPSSGWIQTARRSGPRANLPALTLDYCDDSQHQSGEKTVISEDAYSNPAGQIRIGGVARGMATAEAFSRLRVSDEREGPSSSSRPFGFSAGVQEPTQVRLAVGTVEFFPFPVQTAEGRPIPSRRIVDAKVEGRPERVRFIAFRNHYSSCVTVKARVAGSGGASGPWQTVPTTYKLMRSPHFEDDAED